MIMDLPTGDDDINFHDSPRILENDRMVIDDDGGGGDEDHHHPQQQNIIVVILVKQFKQRQTNKNITVAVANLH